MKQDMKGGGIEALPGVPVQGYIMGVIGEGVGTGRR